MNSDNNQKEEARFSSNILSAEKVRNKKQQRMDSEPYFSANSFNETSEIQRGMELESIKNKLFIENNMRAD